MNVITNDDNKSTVALAALRKVYDPEIGLDVVNLGLIYQVNFDDDQLKLNVTMTLTTQFCPMGESIIDEVHNALQASFSDYTVTITLTFEPAWTHEMISDEGRVFLNK
jgi:metal-sulfur cluster biosynthetic enzyme